jgi:hypothetical protein
LIEWQRRHRANVAAAWFDLGVVETEARVDYRLTGHGWSEADVVIGQQQAHLTASYICDALGDLVRAGLEMAAGGSAARVTWALEPGCYRWKFDRRGADLDVEIWSYAGDWSYVEPETDGLLVMHAECTIRALCRAISVAAHSVLSMHGADAYLDDWGTAFPTNDLAGLDSLIAQQDG